jgi:hypothetical protein
MGVFSAPRLIAQTKKEEINIRSKPADRPKATFLHRHKLAQKIDRYVQTEK